MRNTLWVGLMAGGFAILWAVAGYGQASVADAGTVTISATAGRALLDQYCVGCHSDQSRTANLSLENLDLTAVGEDPELWEKAVRKLRAGMMPPPGVPRPPLVEYEALRDFLEAEIDSAATLNPGTKLLHRLNRTEYANAIRDLLDLEINPAMFLPPDDSSRGFDNIAGSLTISPTLLETYVTAATKIARMAVGFWETPTESTYIKRTDASQVYQLEGLPFGTRGGIAVQHVFPADGDYKFTVRNLDIGAYIPGEQLEFSIDNERVHVWPFSHTTLSKEGVSGVGEGFLEVTLPVAAGSHLVGATFVATNYRPSLDVAKHFDRKSLENGVLRDLTNYPALGALVIQGPFNATRPDDAPSIRKVFTCRPSNTSEERPCAEEILETLTRRAYRRPTTADDLEALMVFYEEGRQRGNFEGGIEFALRRLLASPQFLVRAEEESADLGPGEIYRITDLELASRLSFFLWSTIPDDELIEVASQGRLSDPTVLEQQVRRMLVDPRSESLVENFAQQWLYLRNLGTTSPVQTVFPDWDDELRESFARETELLFESIMREDRNILEMLTANYTFWNERLARHYGIPNIYGPRFRRVELDQELDNRRGVLGHGSFLSTTFVQSYRTSPVKRGVWILENILGTPPPEPPPNVPALEETESGPDRVLTIREQMTLHRPNPPCNGCHRLMDSLGFALENFSADARWRTRDLGLQSGDYVNRGNGSFVDTAVEIFDGQMVDGPSELRRALLRYSPQIVRTVTEKLMTYGLGRGVEYFDMPVVRSIVREAEANDYRFSSIVLGIVNSPQFQMRRAAGAPGEE